MKYVVLILLFGSCAYAQGPKELFAKYDFSKLDPKEIVIQFPRTQVTVWDRCSKCDCPEPMVADTQDLQEIDGDTYRKSYEVVTGPRKITGTKQDDGAVLFSRKIDDCKIDSIITYVEDHPKATVPCDPNCAAPAKADVTVHTPDLPKTGCASGGASVWLIPFMVLFFKRKQKYE